MKQMILPNMHDDVYHQLVNKDVTSFSTIVLYMSYTINIIPVSHQLRSSSEINPVFQVATSEKVVIVTLLARISVTV